MIKKNKVSTMEKRVVSKHKTQLLRFRIANTELDPKLTIFAALMRIDGINRSWANDVLKQLQIPLNQRVNQLTQSDWLKINHYCQTKFWNSIGSIVKATTKLNVEHKKKIWNYQGMWHIQNLPVWGSRTSTNAKTWKKYKII